MKLSNTLQASLLKLSAKGISVFAPHTSLDAIEGGINTWLTSAFGSNVQSSRPIEPKFEPKSPAPDHLSAFSDAGMGRIVELKQAIEADEAIKSIKTLLGMSHREPLSPPCLYGTTVLMDSEQHSIDPYSAIRCPTSTL